ncbi:MAG: hypothetical protein WCG75_06210 [Armatimonadota bacterium]
MKPISLVLPFLFISSISFGQGTDPLGSNRPSTYTIASLPNDLIAIDITTSKDNLMSLMQLSFSSGGISGPETGRPSIDPQMLMQLANVIWTSKDDVDGKGEFLMGYKLDVPFSSRPSANVSPSALKFRLTYIRRQAIIALTPREDFSPSTLKEMAKEPTPQQASTADRTVTISNMKQIATGAMIYLSDSDDIFPFVQSTPQLFDVLMPYLKNREILKGRNPMGGEFRFNMSLAGVSATALEAPAETPLLFESVAWPDGKRCVAFADSHVKVVSAEEWDRMQPMLKLKIKRTGKPIPPGATIPPSRPTA